MELKGIEATLRSLLGSSTETSIIAVDLFHRVTLWNRGAERLLGYSAEEELSSGRISEMRERVLRGGTA